jgi:hypothetical protein
MTSSSPLDISLISNPQWWKDLAPNLHVHDVGFLQSQEIMGIDDASAATLQELIRKEGYFQLPPQQWPLQMDEMVAVVKRLNDMGMPLPFSFVYDEFWCLYLRLNKVIESLLGPGFMRLPDFWAWLVDPLKDESGWSPHRDKNYKALFEDGSPKSITIWLPLTDATTLNGCMYLVPADRDPVYGTPQDDQRTFKYADIRALPAAAGSVLCWNQAILHWGSHSSTRESRPRVSVAFEFQSGNIPAYNEPLTRPNEIPAFAFRMRLIGKQIVQYRHMYPLAPEVEAFARTLFEEQPAQAAAVPAATPAGF